MTDLLERPDAWEWIDMAADEDRDRPLVVAYDIKELLAGIRQGVDSANSALALKADKRDLERLASRLDATDVRVGELERGAATATGWRTGFFVAVGIVLGAAPMVAQALIG